MTKDDNLKALHNLAQAYGLITTYLNGNDEEVHAREETILAILRSLNIPIKKTEEAPKFLAKYIQEKGTESVSTVNVIWENNFSIDIQLTKQQLNNTITYKITLESGETLSGRIALESYKTQEKNLFGQTVFVKSIDLPELPYGYHQLKLFINQQCHESLLLCAPLQFYNSKTPPGSRLSGVFSPLYALHDQQSIGCGDLSTLNHFSQWLTQYDTAVIGMLPFFAAYLDEPCDPSPYSPVSRLFWNELYLDVEKTGHFNKQQFQTEVDEANADKLINYHKAMSLKRKILTQQMRHFMDSEDNKREFYDFIEQHDELKNYALFRAKQEVSGRNWQNWPEEDKKCHIQLDNTLEENYYYHLFVQWQLNKQLKTIKAKLNERGQLLYLDLPIGTSPNGYDVWQYQDDFVLSASIGAPPDPVFTDGQNWGMPPLNPLKMRQTHYRYFINMLQTILPCLDILRIDHVMGFSRLYWIPENYSGAEGMYVKYPTEEIYAILSIESHRHKVMFVGENLGTVPKETDTMMIKHGMMQMHILQYALDSKLAILPPSEWVLSSLNTHDMPTFFSYCHLLDIEEKKQNHALSKPELNKQIRTRKANIKKLKNILTEHNLDTNNIVASTLELLANSQASVFLINIEDLWQEKYAQNVPESDHPNWRRKLAYSVEQLSHLQPVNQLLQRIAKIRPNIFHHQTEQKSAEQFISRDDLYLFNEGTHYRLYNYLGAHTIKQDEQEGTHFAVWAPNASYVSVIGDFNFWQKESHSMQPLENSGIWTIFIPEAQIGHCYKYYIESTDNNFIAEKADPFAFYQEIAPKTASIIWDSQYQWQDEEWMKKRGQMQSHHAPISIYEVHLGSWQRVPEEGNRFLTYRELAPLLTEYVRSMNFTHVELLPVMEHPFYGSWGYQTLGYFAPSSRYGNPDDFKYFIDYLHQHDIGVILDWVPSHFPNDPHGLAYFDGTHLYEHSDPRLGFHPDWKSAIFNYGRHEVRAFLISSAIFWLDHYHIDGIRVDAVASMLYLNYSRPPGEWLPNQHGSNENLEAIQFLRDLNRLIYQNYPDAETFAEESTAWPNVSRPLETGGLGFGFKWDMGWMHDTLQYFSHDPIHRRFHQHQLSFRMVYAFNENFTLSLSHDEVVHGKRSLINRMPGDEWSQFANLRLLYGYMYAMPGKKLLFMGNEFGQRVEWNHEHSLDWHVLNWPVHKNLQQWVSDLNKLYKEEAALHDFDSEPAGFAWIDCQDSNNSIFSFIRISANHELILIVLNCTPVLRSEYRIGVPKIGKWQLIASSNASSYGGTGTELTEAASEMVNAHNQNNSVILSLPGLSILFYKWVENDHG